MAETFIQKTLSIRGKEKRVYFRWDYVKRKRQDIFEKAKERCMMEAKCQEEDLTFFVERHRVPYGYMSMSRNGESFTPTLLSSEPIEEQEVLDLLK
jgi:hypothetical protein